MPPGHESSARETLLALLRAWPDDEPRAGAAVAAVGGEAHWQALIEHAAAHGVLGILAPLFSRAATLPERVRADLGRRLAVQSAWQEHLAASLEDVVRILSDARVPACALKGPVLAARLYGPADQRPSIDVDLLVRPADVERASAALAAAGYARDEGVTAAYLLQHGHHVHFSRPGRPVVELHFHAYAGFGVVLPADALMARAREYPLSARTTVLVPSLEDEFLYLAVHAAGHSFVRMLWLYDLKLLLRRAPIDWALVSARATDAHVATAVNYAARLLDEWLAVKVPRMAENGSNHLRLRLADRLLPGVSRPSEPGALDNLGGLVFTAMLCDGRGRSAWLLQHHLLRATRRRLKRLAPGVLPERWSG